MSIAVLYLLRGWHHEPPTDTLLRRCAEDFLQLPPGELAAAAVTRTEHGKPGFADLPVEVSVSHTGRLFAALIQEKSAGPVGLDIQYKRAVDHERLSARFFTEEEHKYVLNEGKDGFFRLWTRKEALTKWRGLPLAATLRHESLVLEGELTEAIGNVRFIEPKIDNDVCTCIAVQADRKVELCSKEMNEKQFYPG
jgi:phosphopantetheinyl transferase